MALSEKAKKWQTIAGFAGRDNKAVALIPKAGCQSIGHAIGKRMTPEQAWNCDTRLAFIRHPMERLESGWSFFYWMNARGTSHSGPGMSVTERWQTWVDYILEYSDPHWVPQSDLIGDFPNQIYRFEDILCVWEDYFPGFFPHKNKVTRLKASPYRVRDIERRYCEDFELWHSLQPIAA